jgi:hypothetical protein
VVFWSPKVEGIIYRKPHMLGAKSGKNQVSCKKNPSTNPVKFNNYVSKDVNNINIGQE